MEIKGALPCKVLFLVCMAGFTLAASSPSLPQDLRQRAWSVIDQIWTKGPHIERDFMVGELWRVDDTRVRVLLMSALGDHPRGARFSAARAMCQRPYPDAVEEMSKALASETEFIVRVFLVDAIMASGHPNAARLLAPSIHDPHPIVRKKVLGELERLGEQATDVWISELSNPDAETRARAVRVLGKRGGTGRLQAALTDADPMVRQEAAFVLASMGNTAAMPELVKFLEQDPKSPYRLQIAQALSRLGDPRGTAVLENALRQNDAVLRAGVAALLPDTGILQTSALLASLAERDSDSRVRVAALNSILRIGDDEAVRVLRVALKDPDEWTRVHAAKLLLARGDHTGRPILMSALGSGDSRIRRHASEDAAAYLTADEAYILAKLLEDSESMVCAQAMQAAAKLGVRALIPEIRRILMNPDELRHMMATAAVAIGGLGGTEAIEVLQEALDAETAGIRIAAAIAILRLVPASPSGQ